jgi:hypothetical protein
MKKLITFFSLLLTCSYIQAQDNSIKPGDNIFAIGKTSVEVRRLAKRLKWTVVSNSDTVDKYSDPDLTIIDYYKNNICYKSTTILPLQGKFLMQAAFDSAFKKVKENTWIDTNNNIKINLTVDSLKKQFRFDVTTANY